MSGDTRDWTYDVFAVLDDDCTLTPDEVYYRLRDENEYYPCINSVTRAFQEYFRSMDESRYS